MDASRAVSFSALAEPTRLRIIDILARQGELTAGQISEKARSAAARTSNPFSAAIEAGKDAYADEKRKTEVKSITEGRPTYPVKDETS